MPKIYDLEHNRFCNEKEYKTNLLNKLYTTWYGRILLKLIFCRPYFSKIRAIYQKSKKSKKDIAPFIQKYSIDTSMYDVHTFHSFNDFFIRKRTIENKSNEKELVAIADSKLSIYKISNDLKLNIKNSIYTLNEIVGGKLSLDDYQNGYCLIYRLSVYDYHRYVFPDDGEYLSQYHIKGVLHTIRPIASKYKAYSSNSRTISFLHTKHFGDIVQIEVGAMLVGCIQNHKKKTFQKLEEKGYFEYGGSTVVLLLKNNVIIDKNILDINNDDIEIKVKIGDRIGVVKNDSNDETT